MAQCEQIAGGSPNGYEYCGGDSVNCTDPTGKDVFWGYDKALYYEFLSLDYGAYFESTGDAEDYNIAMEYANEYASIATAVRPPWIRMSPIAIVAETDGSYIIDVSSFIEPDPEVLLAVNFIAGLAFNAFSSYIFGP